MPNIPNTGNDVTRGVAFVYTLITFKESARPSVACSFQTMNERTHHTHPFPYSPVLVSALPFARWSARPPRAIEFGDDLGLMGKKLIVEATITPLEKVYLTSHLSTMVYFTPKL